MPPSGFGTRFFITQNVNFSLPPRQTNHRPFVKVTNSKTGIVIKVHYLSVGHPRWTS